MIQTVVPAVAVVRHRAGAQVLRRRSEDLPLPVLHRCAHGHIYLLACPARAGNDEARALCSRARAMIISGDFNFVLLELGCASDSELSANVREHCVAIRVTVKEDLTSTVTKRALHSILRLCKLHGIETHIWVSIPCT